MMNSQYSLKISREQAKEMPMVDLAFMILKAANTPFYYRDLMQEIAAIKGISDDQVMDVIAQLYTEINIDGRFACVGNNLWGLKRWYPVDKSGDEAVGSASYPRIINDDDDDLDDEELFSEEEDETYSDDEEFDGDSDDDEESIYDDVDDDEVEDEDKEIEDLDEELDEEFEGEMDEDIEEELDDLDEEAGDDEAEEEDN